MENVLRKRRYVRYLIGVRSGTGRPVVAGEGGTWAELGEPLCAAVLNAVGVAAVLIATAWQRKWVCREMGEAWRETESSRRGMGLI
ncbi:unnamed protein product [Ilex paraguariensis]|uniref:Uncharacterized protein n=1 Tax=Ilex paraguariensis TaxID=185542 RepID=A0ABC8UUN4_9AQUA